MLAFTHLSSPDSSPKKRSGAGYLCFENASPNDCREKELVMENTKKSGTESPGDSHHSEEPSKASARRGIAMAIYSDVSTHLQAG